MSKVNAQLLQQRRFTIIPFRRESRNPTSPQPALLTHPPTDTLRTKRGSRKVLRWSSDAIAALVAVSVASGCCLLGC